MVAGTAQRIALDGRLDQDNAAARLAASENWFGGGQPLIVDLAGVERADSAGVALLLAWQRRAIASGVDLQFANIPAGIRAFIDLCGLTSVLSVEYPDNSAGADSG